MISRKLQVQMIFLSAVGIISAGGSITGTVKYDGKIPRMKKLKMDAEPICSAKHLTPVTAEWLLAGENGELKNAFVYIKEGLGNREYPVPEEPVVLDQNGCIYSPHVLGLQVGQNLEIRNSDGILHNIHAKPAVNKEFNRAQPKFKKKMIVTFDKPEIMLPVTCDVHPWMRGWIGVLNHPCFTVTDESGTFSIDGLDPGNYIVEVWHEKLGTKSAEVTVSDDKGAIVDFVLKRPPKKPKN